ncbi:MAG: hypothetical protein RMK84_17850 [Oscillochloridaceae bacterium]|nr:hypothetical protein [Chloroflexaceae bacterium]MDW8391989.1 hypothetical protein [Oscillochloridaceae bacterium]
MTSDETGATDLPADLKALLDAAGVTDAASLQRALESDPQLRERFVAFVQAQVQALGDAVVAALLADVPEDLRARLEAAGGSDQAVLQQALEADAQLKADLKAFLEARRTEALPQGLDGYLTAFAEVEDTEQLGHLWM